MPETLTARAARSSFWKKLKAFGKNRTGIAALEFAMIAPFMLCMYFVTLEVSQAIDVNRKLNRLSGTVADLLTQGTKTTPADLKAILAIGQQVLQPYGRTEAVITVTAIQLALDPYGKQKDVVVWSAKMEKGAFVLNPLKKGDTVTSVPPSLDRPDTFLIKVETSLNYVPIIAWTADQKANLGLMAIFSDIRMGENYYLPPRMSSDVKCDGC